MTSPTRPDSARSKVGAVFRVTSGNFLEQFDFFLFGFYATYIAAAFFPAANEFASLMMTFAVFGAGFLMRPLGAIILGAYIDDVGRRKGLIVTLSIMASGTLLIVLVPSYQTIGLWAPFLVLLGRLLQGFSAGAELGGVSVYLAEIATPGRKGFFVSWQSASQQAAVVFAGLLGVGLNHWLSPEEMGEWGWRIPFLLGCMIVPVIFVIRRSMEETPEFEARKHHPTLREILRSVGQNFGLVLGGMALVVMTTVSFYLITAYTPTFGKAELHLSDFDALLVTVCIGLSNFFWLPVMGSLSDKIGRKPLLLGATILAILTAYPALSWLVANPSFSHLLIVELWLSFLYGSYNGAMVVALTEIMPVEVRTTGFSLAYSLATATFGGFTPAACTYLIHALDNKAAPGLWLTGAAILGLIATVVLFRGNQHQLRTAQSAVAGNA